MRSNGNWLSNRGNGVLPDLDQLVGVGPLTVLLQSRLLQGQLAVVAGHAKAQQAVILHGLLKALIRHLQQIGQGGIGQRHGSGLGEGGEIGRASCRERV